MNDKNNIGDYATVIGNVNSNVGNYSTVVGPTDNRGNTILNQSMAVGYGAKAGPNSIAIGAFAGAGYNIDNLLDAIGNLVGAADDCSLSADFNLLKIEIKSGKKSKQEISSSLDNFLNKCKNATSVIANIATIAEWILKLKKFIC
jgi:hypothetical protein